MATVIIFQGKYHLGNNSGIFQDASFVGLRLLLPVNVVWLDPAAATYDFVVFTQDVESWGGATNGHPVTVAGLEVGRIKDPNDTFGPMERHVLTVDGAILRGVLGALPFRTTIGIEIENLGGGLEDDFLLLRMETSENIVIRLGG